MHYLHSVIEFFATDRGYFAPCTFLPFTHYSTLLFKPVVYYVISFTFLAVSIYSYRSVNLLGFLVFSFYL